MTELEQNLILEAREILARYINRNPVLTCWQAVLDYCALAVRGEEERFHALYLDRKNRLISDECLAVGTVDHVPVYPREVVKRALLLNATALIIVHNHPAGSGPAVPRKLGHGKDPCTGDNICLAKTMQDSGRDSTGGVTTPFIISQLVHSPPIGGTVTSSARTDLPQSGSPRHPDHPVVRKARPRDHRTCGLRASISGSVR